MNTPHIPETSNQSAALRVALGPGFQAGGVTEGVLRQVARTGS